MKNKKKPQAARTKQKASNWKDDCLVLGGRLGSCSRRKKATTPERLMISTAALLHPSKVLRMRKIPLSTSSAPQADVLIWCQDAVGKCHRSSLWKRQKWERKKKTQLNFSLSNSEVAPQHTVVPQTGSRPLPRPLVLFEELCTRSLCKLSTQHFPRRRRGLCNLQKKKKKSG